MQLTEVPTRFGDYWGNNAGVGYIRDIPSDSQIGVEIGAASLEDGFPPECFTPIGAGGVPPFGKDFNGIIRWVTQWARWQSAGGLVPYNSTFASDIGGYPKGAILVGSDTGRVHFNIADNNSTDPDGASPSNWLSGDIITGLAATGEFRWRPTEETLTGWVRANKKSIGNASSNATGRANSDAYRLFKWHWTNFSNTQCQLYDSGGSPVSRGASSDADWSANRAIETIDLRGTNPIGMDTMGGVATTRLSGVPVVTGSAVVAGSVLGENLHALVVAEIPSHLHTGTTNNGGADHTHQYWRPSANNQDPGAGGASGLTVNKNEFSTSTGTATAYLHTHSFTTGNTGSNGSHNTVSRVMAGTWYIKL